VSTENEGTEVPPAPSTPPIPADGPAPADAAVPVGSSAPAAPSAAPAPGVPGDEASATAVQRTVPDAAAGPDDSGTAQLPAYPPPLATPKAPPPPGEAQKYLSPGADQGAVPTTSGGVSENWPPPQPATPGYGSGEGSPAYGAGAGSSGFGGGAGSSGFGGGEGSSGYGSGEGSPGFSGGEGGPGYGSGEGGPGFSGGEGGWGSSYQSTTPRPGGRRGGLVAAVLVAALIAGGVGGGIGYWAAERGSNSTDSTTVSASGPSDVKRPPTSVAGIAARSLPSVVTIEAQSGNGDGGTGTGFVYDKQGHILTNNHVVAAAANGGKLSATFSDGRKYTAEVVGRAKGYDVAVIKLKNAPTNLKPLVLGDSDQVAVGDSTIAIGAPFGLSNTVTTGIVSAKDRPVTTSDDTGGGGGGAGSSASYMSALQTDASINPGNSGGPLMDARGAVIGINSAIKPSSDGGGLTGGQGGSIGLGFAIPINTAKFVAQQLIKTGQPIYPVIGASVSLQDQSDGAQITDQGVGNSNPITPGGPAAKAGLKPGDVITKLDSTVIDSGPTLIGEIWNHQPGDTVTLTYKRGGQSHTVKVVLGERKGDSSQ
jgi:putative serine protease PepD